jgi:hypothetical protein
MINIAEATLSEVSFEVIQVSHLGPRLQVEDCIGELYPNIRTVSAFRFC